jgi:phage protein D/phage baseplate assembly protein gpV
MKPQSSVPNLVVELDGNALSVKALAHLEEVLISRCLSQPGLCELSFVMPETAPWPETGMTLRVSLEHAGDLLFQGEVASVEYNRRSSGERILFVRAYDALLNLRRQHRIRAWPVSSASSIALEMTSGMGLTVEGGTDAPDFPYLIQSEESDFDFLTGVAERSGLYLALHGDVLQLTSLEGVGEEIMLKLDDGLLEVSVESNATFACDGVKSYGWDASRVERHVAEVSRPTLDADKDAGSGVAILSNGNASAQEIAQASAAAEMSRRVSRSRTVRGTAEGNVDLMPGTKIRVEGLPSSLPDTFTLVEVTHRIDGQSGFVTTFSSTPPPRRPSNDAASVAWGVVTQIQDPERLGRVRVALPTLDDVETDWLEVLAIGAGSGKGFVNLPDRGDKVVVLFPRGDMGCGLILGGLYGTDGPGDYGVEDKVVRYALLTPGGSKLRFDDSRKSLRIEDVTGSYMEFTPGGATLHAAADLRIEAPGRKMTISAQQIDFRRS